eukprot:8650115-Pyramimonas_sp.AAC.1
MRPFILGRLRLSGIFIAVLFAMPLASGALVQDVGLRAACATQSSVVFLVALCRRATVKFAPLAFNSS